MIDATVAVYCDFVPDDDEGCEAEFEVSRTDLPVDLHEIVECQLRLRGWTGSVAGRVTCPLHATTEKEVMP